MGFNILTVGKGNVLKDSDNNQYTKVPFIKIEGDLVSLSEDISNQETDIIVSSGLISKGDILVHNGNQITRLPVGINGLLLSADSGSPTGLAWTAADVGFSTVNNNFSIPPFNSTVTVTVSSTRWMNVGQNLYVETAGEYKVTAINSTTSVTIRNNRPTNPSSGTVTLARKITPSGEAGENGYTYTNTSFNIPNVGSTVTIEVMLGTILVPNQNVYIEGAGYFKINSKPTPTSLVIENLGWVGNLAPNTSIPTNRLISPSGIKGGDGVSSFTNSTASFTMPEVEFTVTIAVISSQGFAIGQNIFITNAGAFEITEIPNLTSLTIKNLGNDINVAPTSTVATNQKIVSAGFQGSVGRDAVGILTANFTQPAIDANVTINVDNTFWTTTNAFIFHATGGFYQVVSIGSSTQMTIKNIGSGFNANAGTNITSGSKIIASAKPGNDGINGINGTNGTDGLNAYTRTTTSLTIPNLNSTAIVNVEDSQWITLNQLIFIEGNTLRVTNINSNQITLRNDFDHNSIGQVIPINSLMVTGAMPGTSGHSIVLTSFSMPDNASTVVVTLNQTNWLSPNLSIFIANAGYFIVQSITPTTATILPYPDPINASPSTNIPVGSVVSPAGLRGSDASEISIALQLNKQSLDPSPIANKILLYAKSDGLYQIDENGIVSKVGDEEVFLPIQNEGIDLPLQPKLNFTGDLVNATNDNPNNRTNINITSGLTDLGDMLYHNGIQITRLPRGTQGQVLSSHNTTGLTWVNPVTSYNDLTDRPSLGTASAFNVGTSIGNVVQLIDSGGTPKLPSIDGSLLTNLPTTSLPDILDLGIWTP